MDVLIVKKKPGRKIDKNIGRIFKDHNVIEFKSETDTLNWQGYNKVLAYGLLYSAFHKVLISDITLTFCVTAYPRALLDYLQKERGLVIVSVEPGIYNIVGDIFTIQLLESKRLTAQENLFVHNLRSNLTAAEVSQVADAYRSLRDMNRKRTYFNTLLQANSKIFKEVNNMYPTIEELYEMVMELPAWSKMLRRDSQKIAEEREKEIAQKLLARGLSPTAIAEDMGLPIDDVLALA